MAADPTQILRAWQMAKNDGNFAAADDLHKMLLQAYRDEVPSATEGMSVGDRVKANIGAGLMDNWVGLKQSLGMASGESARDKAALDAALADSLPGGSVLQFAGEAAPTLALPALAGVRGAMAGGTLLGALMPTEDDNIAAGKAINAGIGALSGGTLAKYGPAIGRKVGAVVGDLRDRAISSGLSTGAARQRLTDRMFTSVAGDPVQAERTITTNMLDEIPGVNQTTGALLGNREMLGIEKALRETQSTAGGILREQSATNNAVRAARLRSALDVDPAPIHETASKFIDAAKRDLSLQPGGVDPNNMLRKQLSYWQNRAESPAAKQAFQNLKDRLAAILQAPEDRQMDLIHQFRITGINDELTKAMNSERGAAKLLRHPLSDFKSKIDAQIQKRLASGDWEGAMRGFSARKTVAEKADNAQDIFQKILDRQPLSDGEISVTGARGILRRSLNPSRAETDFGRQTLGSNARDAMEGVLRSADREMAPFAADVGARGSNTAANLQVLRQYGMEQPGMTMMEGLKGITGVLAAGAVNPIAGVATGAAMLGAHKLSQRAAQDIAGRLLTTYRDPQAALRALRRAQLPPSYARQIAKEIARRFPQAGGALLGASTADAVQ